MKTTALKRHFIKSAIFRALIQKNNEEGAFAMAKSTINIHINKPGARLDDLFGYFLKI